MDSQTIHFLHHEKSESLHNGNGYSNGNGNGERKRHIAVDTMGLLLAGVFSRYSGPGRSQSLASEIVRAL